MVAELHCGVEAILKRQEANPYPAKRTACSNILGQRWPKEHGAPAPPQSSR